MGRGLVALGLIIIFASVIYMLAVMGVFGQSVSAQFMGTILCEDNETFSQRYGEYRGSIENVPAFFMCTDSEGIERNVNGGAIATIVIGFVGLLLTGIIIVNIGARRAVKEGFATFGDETGTGFHIARSTINYDNNTSADEMREILQSSFDVAGKALGVDSLSDKLQQLDDALDKGLISKSEYETARQNLLDNFDD